MSVVRTHNIPHDVAAQPVTQGRVFVVGSSNVDLVAYVNRFPRAGETLFGKEFETKFGGKGANQAVAAAKLGARVTMLTMIGTDNFGDNYLKHYEELKVDTSLILRTDKAATGIATIAVDGEGENCIIVVPGANACLTPEAVRAAPSLAEKMSGCSVFVIQNEVPASTNAALIQEASTRGLITMFNAAPATDLEEPYRSQLLSHADVICVNEEEATALTGCAVDSEEDCDKAAAELLKVMGGDGFVLLTLGKRGCMVHGRPRGNSTGEVVTSRAPAGKVETVVDTVGAGDCFMGATATYLASVFANLDGSTCPITASSGAAGSDDVSVASVSSASDPESLLRRRRTLLAKYLSLASSRANIVAAESVQRKGAQSSYPDAAEVPAFFAEQSS